MISNSSYKPNFPPELLLNNSQAAKLYKVLSNNLSFNIKFLNTQVSKTVQSGGKTIVEYPASVLGPLIKTGLPSKKRLF